MGKAKGRCPSLIAANHGKPKFEKAIKKRTCKRCKKTIPGGTDCVAIPTPGTMGSRIYCNQCFGKIIEQTQKDINELKKW